MFCTPRHLGFRAASCAGPLHAPDRPDARRSDRRSSAVSPHCASYHGRLIVVLRRARASPIKGRHPYLSHLSTAGLPPPCPPPCASRAAGVEARASALLAAVRPARPSSSPCWSGRSRSLPCPGRAHAGASGPAAGAGRRRQAPSPEPPHSFL
jgi:hypothetical protein